MYPSRMFSWPSHLILSSFFALFTVGCNAPSTLAAPEHLPVGAISIHMPMIDILDWDQTTYFSGEEEAYTAANASTTGYGFQYEYFLTPDTSVYASLDSRIYDIQDNARPDNREGLEYRLGSRLRWGADAHGWIQYFWGSHLLLGSGWTFLDGINDTGVETTDYWGLGVEAGAHFFVSPMVSVEATLSYEHLLGEPTRGDNNPTYEEGLRGLTSLIGLVLYY